MMRSTTTLMIAASLFALGACAKKPPKELPPPPIDTTGPVTPQNSGTGAIVPGSQEDFVATVSSDRIFFDTDSSDVDAPDQATLQSQAAWLSKYPAKQASSGVTCN